MALRPNVVVYSWYRGYFPSLVRRIKRSRTHTSSEMLNSSALVNTTSRISNQSKSTKPIIFLSIKYFEWDVFTFFFLQSQLLLCRILEATISDVRSQSASPPPSPKDHDLDLETRFETEAAFEQEQDEVSIVSGGSSSTLGSTPPKVDLKYVMRMRVHFANVYYGLLITLTFYECTNLGSDVTICCTVFPPKKFARQRK